MKKICIIMAIVMFIAFIAFCSSYDNSHKTITAIVSAFIFSLSLFIFVSACLKMFIVKLLRKILY
ncbi:MAG: hypothetical protein LBP40_01340 [Campylobacteraceae bacterium]|nr:hypothetical protein [Campylobacteraceae bacterium]